MSSESNGAKDRSEIVKIKVLANYGNMQPNLSDYSDSQICTYLSICINGSCWKTWQITSHHKMGSAVWLLERKKIEAIFEIFPM